MAHHASTAHTADPHGHDDGHHQHVVPFWMLVLVLMVLLFLTVVTVGVTVIDLGSTGNLILAIGIAVIKASIVGLYFMHLRWDSLFNGFILIASLAFVGLLILIAGMDKEEYTPSIKAREIQQQMLGTQ